MSTIRRKHRTDEQWEAIEKAWQLSGQTQTAFCKDHQIAVGTFHNWRHRKRRKSSELSSNEFVSVTPTSIAPTASAAFSIELELSDGLVLRIQR